MIKACFLTSVHIPSDTRIFHKEAKSLAKAGYDVTLIAQHDKEEIVDGVRIVPLPSPKNRFERITMTVWRVYRKALQIDANIYHFHDPELIPIGILLRLHGKKVLYDVHEDVPQQNLYRHWIPPILRKPISKVISFAEIVAARSLNGIVAATPYIAARFPPDKTMTLQNFPILDQFQIPRSLAYDKLPHDVAYVGVIAYIRGAREMIQVMDLLPQDLNVRLVLAGKFSPPMLEQELRSLSGWSRVEFLGWQNRAQVVELLGRVRAGIVVLLPIANYLDSYPVKLFEYMAAGIPVIASNFPLWKEIVEGAGCGICVNPLNPKEMAEAIRWVVEHPIEAEQMGKNGRRAVEERYNWGMEEKKLLGLYERISQ